MVVDLNNNYLKYEILDYRSGVVLRISQGVRGIVNSDVLLDEDELKDVIKFCIEDGFLDWDCSECPIQ